MKPAAPRRAGKSGCVAAGRGGLGEAGSALTFSNCKWPCGVIGQAGGGGSSGVGSPKILGECWLRNESLGLKEPPERCLQPAGIL